MQEKIFSPQGKQRDGATTNHLRQTRTRRQYVLQLIKMGIPKRVAAI
jgi:hypothetical protein